MTRAEFCVFIMLGILAGAIIVWSDLTEPVVNPELAARAGWLHLGAPRGTGLRLTGTERHALDLGELTTPGLYAATHEEKRK